MLLCTSAARAQPPAEPSPAAEDGSAADASPADASPAAAPSPAAQGTAGAATRQAEALYRQGITQFEAGHWREAVELFKQADALAPSPWLSFNIAKIFERMRDHRSALAWYRDYARRSTDAPLPDVLRRIEELEAELRAQGVQQLSVLSTPPGATVVLDGVSRGVTPYTCELPPGPHVLELRLRGHRDTWRELELPAEHALDVGVTLVGADPGDGLSPQAPEVAAPAPGPGSSIRLASSAPAGAAEPARALASWWTWGLFGGSAALLLGSGAAELSRRGLEERARDTRAQVDYQRRYEQVQARRDVARVLLGLGAVLGAAGGVSLYLDLGRGSADDAGLALGCAREVCGLHARRAW